MRVICIDANPWKEEDFWKPLLQETFIYTVEKEVTATFPDGTCPKKCYVLKEASYVSNIGSIVVFSVKRFIPLQDEEISEQELLAEYFLTEVIN